MQPKLSKRRRSELGVSGVVFMLIMLSFYFPTTIHAQKTDDFFYSDGEKVHVTVSFTSIGILARDGVSTARLRTLADSLDLRLIQELPGGIFILGLNDTLTRGGLVSYAWEIRDRQTKIVAQAGLVVTPVGVEVPLILTDEFIAKFKSDVTKEQIYALNKENGIDIVSENPYVRNQYLLRITKASEFDALRMANRYHENPLVEFSHPNFVRVIELRFIPNDALFNNQWHLRNTGQGAGTVDADIDADLAWNISTGVPGVVIAVIDEGFDWNHPDLAPNRWVNPGEIAGNGIDDDGNSYIDDVNGGWDFAGNDNDPTGGNHGTAVAGTASARGNNSIGVTGSCPNCNLMFIRYGSTFNDDVLAFGYAQNNGASIITNSWSYNPPSVLPTAVANAITSATTAGITVLFASGNIDANVCSGTNINSLASRADVIGVCSSSNQDRKVVNAGFGDCVDILAPSHRGYFSTDPFTGTLWVTTTDRIGTPGYNNANPPPYDLTGLTETGDRNYTNFFGGTSSATPLTAGVVGLILSVNPGLTRVQVQRLLQDCADKIEPGVAAYDPNTGFSSPATGVATHSWGRLNAFEAVHVAAPVANGGKGGVDIFLRDNYLDWGNTEQPSNTLFEATRGYIGHWQSMDIKVDAPPYQGAPTSATFDAFTDETPSAVSGDVNKVYVRVRNRGPNTASSVTVKLHWTQFGTSLPALPADFWSAWPGNSSNTTDWHPLQRSGSSSYTCTINNLAYSGSTAARDISPDPAQIVVFDFPAPPVDASKPNHFCLAAMIDSPQDRILPKSGMTLTFNSHVVDDLTPNDNNATHRNYVDLHTSRSTYFEERFYVRNPLNIAILTALRVKGLPEGWSIKSKEVEFNKLFTLQPGQEILVRAEFVTPERNLSGDVTIIQERTDVEPKKVMGGITLHFQSKPQRPCRFSLSIHSGVAIPYDSLSNDFNTGLNVLADLDFHFTQNWSIVGFAGYNGFESKVTEVNDDYWLNFSLDARYNQPIANLVSPYIQVGPGYYISGSGSSGFGANVGVGIDYLFKPWLTIEAGADYHRLFNQNTQFLHVHGGVIFRF